MSVEASNQRRWPGVVGALVPLLMCAAFWVAIGARSSGLDRTAAQLGKSTLLFTSLVSYGPLAWVTVLHIRSHAFMVAGAGALWIAWLSLVAFTRVGNRPWIAYAIFSTAWLVTGFVVAMYVGSRLT